MLQTIIVMLKGVSSIVRRINVYTLYGVRLVLLKRL